MKSTDMQRETCCILCDLRIGVIVLAITSMIESGQQILISFALAVSHASQYSKYPSSNVALLHVYATFQILYFVSVLFGLLAVVSQGRHFRHALLCWIVLSLAVSIIQLIYLFYVIAYFNKRTFSLIAVTLVLFFVPKNSLFACVVYKYYKLLVKGFYSPDYDDLDYTKDTFRRSRAGSSRRDSLHTLKDGMYTAISEVPSKQETEARNSRKVSTSNVLKVIPELSESRDSSLESKESAVSAKCSYTKTVESA